MDQQVYSPVTPLTHMDKKTKNIPWSLITGNEGTYRVSEDTITEFEEAVLSDKGIRRAPTAPYVVSRASFRLWSGLWDVPVMKSLPRLAQRTLPAGSPQLCILMGPRLKKCFPWFLLGGPKAVYLFDAWPHYYPLLVKFLSDFSVDPVFVSSQQSAENLSRMTGHRGIHWIPEGVDPCRYHYSPYTDKTIDLLFMGRRFEPVHRKMVGPLAEKGVTYLYTREEGGLVFPDFSSFREGLAQTRISVCYPASVTHPERAAGVETMTNRYLQSMASKCLVVGKTPAEMIALFGYDPVIALEEGDPAGHILDILAHFDRYVPLIERNYDAVRNHHTWLHRWQEMTRWLGVR